MSVISVLSLDSKLPLGLWTHGRSLGTMEGLVELSLTVLFLPRNLDDLFYSIWLGHVFAMEHKLAGTTLRPSGEGTYLGR